MNDMVLPLQMLVVDDDDVDRERVRRFLARSALSVEIREASCGAEALMLIKAHAFDCVVLDNQLGDANGAELMSQLHTESRQDCPIIMITGAGNEALAVRAMQEGASDYLAKTQLNAESLARSVRRSVEHHRLRVELASMHQQLEQRVEDQAATIRQRERDLRALVDNAPTVMGYWDRDQRCRFGNHTHREWFGLSASELPGQHLREVLGPTLHTALQPRIDAALAGQTQQFEHPLALGSEGSLRHAQVQLRPDLADDGEVQGFYATLADVTPIKLAQAHAEEHLRFSEAVIEHSPIGIAVFTPEGRCVIANAAFADTSGETPEALRHTDYRQRATWRACGLVEEARQTLADGLTRRLDVTLIKPGGEEVQLACALARVDRGGQAQLLLMARDTTEQGLAHAALVAARDAAESAARTKGAFLANMSHEIRTPMNAIIGLSRLALEDTLPESAREYLDKVHTSALALMGILDDVLDYSKIEAGHLHFEHIGFDIEALLQRTADLFQARIEQKGLSLSIALSPEVPRRLMGDPLRLSQVLSNLMGNALKFTESGYIHLTVDALGTPSDLAGAPPTLLRFAVADTGVGIDSSQQALLFEAFVQGDNSVTRRFGGTGLGLAICKRLVQLMHGEIGVNSQAGLGSEFWFTARLPVDPSPLLPPRAEVFPGKLVLVIDGHTLMRESTVRQLQSWQASATSAESVAHAIEQVQGLLRQGHLPDAVILDFETCWSHDPGGVRQLRQLFDGATQSQRAPPPLLLMLQARTRHARRHDTRLWPAEVVLVKPVMASRLASALHRAVDQVDRRPDGALTAAASHPGPDAIADAGEHARARSQALGALAAPLRGLQVLLAEDNRLNQIVAEGFLSQLGLVVTVVDDGAAAVSAMQSAPAGHFVAVLMDLHMPVLDGLEATRRIRALPQAADTPVIGMTAAVLPDDRARCLEAGMVDHIAKPIVPERLVQVLLKWARPDTPTRPVPPRPLASLGPTEPPEQASPPEAAEAPPSDTPLALDLAALRHRLHGNERLLWALLSAFVDSVAEADEVVAALLAHGEVAAARLKAHDIKGMAANLGAMRLSAACDALAQALADGRNRQEAVADFHNALQTTMTAIRAAILDHQAGPPA